MTLAKIDDAPHDTNVTATDIGVPADDENVGPPEVPAESRADEKEALNDENITCVPTFHGEIISTSQTPMNDPSISSPVLEQSIGEGSAQRDTIDAKAVSKECLDEVEESKDDGDDESQYPSGVSLLVLTIGLSLATFVIALDNTIIATAIPSITTAFNSLDDIGWYGSAYLLTTTSLQPSFGKVYTYFNVKWTYLFALVIFELGSIICAAAKNSPTFIVGRAVAGSGAAALYSGGMTILGYSVPLRKRALYVASLSSMYGIASVVGPILGGVLTDRASWRWCFWINLPFGGIALLTVFIFFKVPERRTSTLSIEQKLREIDLLGAMFLISGIVCMLLALQWGGTTIPWRDSKIIGLFIGFGLLIAIFIAIQIKLGEKATIPPRIIKQRTVLSSSLYSCLLGMGLYIHIYYLPFYFQAVKATSAEESGIRSIPYLISLTMASVVVGAAITRIGYYPPFMWFGAAVFTIGSGILFTLQVYTSTAEWIGYQILAGAGAGAGVQVPFVAVQVVLNAVDMPSGNAIVIFFNTLGGAIAISIAQNVFTNTLVKEIPKYAPGIDPKSIIATGATHLRDVVPADQLEGVLDAYTIAINRAFIPPIAVGIAALFASAFVEWKSMKGMRGKKVVVTASP